jgi:hypothetical protein
LSAFAASRREVHGFWEPDVLNTFQPNLPKR